MNKLTDEQKTFQKVEEVDIDKEIIFILLKEAKDHLLQFVQWQKVSEIEWSSNATVYLAKADAMIELAEVIDCGQTGGYGYKEPINLSLFGRWNWLRKKYCAKSMTTKLNGWELTKYFDLKRGYGV